MWVVRAVHTFAAEHSDELEFEAGEEIEILEKDEAFGDGWWRVSRGHWDCLLTAGTKHQGGRRPLSCHLHHWRPSNT